MPETVAAVQARILTALIADARGHGLQAVDALAEALAMAEPEGIRRPFLPWAAVGWSISSDRQGLLATGALRSSPTS